jgi:hypothetical protein
MNPTVTFQEGAALAKKRQNWAVWKGPEVEGKLLGTATLYVADRPGGSVDPINSLLGTGDYQHLWVCNSYISAYGFGDVAKWANNKKLTVSVELLPSDLVSNKCHIVLAVSVPELDRFPLRGSHSVRIDTAPYNVYSFPWSTAVETQVNDYDVDTLLLSR